MKYIRTKDGRVIDITNITCWKTKGNKGRYVNGTLEETNNLHLWLLYHNTTIVKQAATIEELIDEYVTIDSRFDYKQLKRKPSICNIYEIGDEKFVYWNDYSKEPLLKEVLKETNVYGAIWTDKGLIYVAKLNDKGDLELL